ncbi:MAG: SURF1 family protein [Hyphomicrobiales bacterium]
MTTEIKQPVFTRGFAFLSVFAFGALAVLIILGSWQVKRLIWKEALIANVETKVKANPIPFATVESQLTGKIKKDRQALEYQPVTVSGTLDHDKEMFYFATLDGDAGFHVYTPLTLSGSGKTVIINRGFVPTEQKLGADRPNSQPTGEIDVTGLVRFPDIEKPNRFLPDNDPKANIFFWRSMDDMIQMAGLDAEKTSPLFVYENELDNNRLPIGGVTIIEFPNNHLGYAVTWYGLALTLIGVYMALAWSRFKASA